MRGQGRIYQRGTVYWIAYYHRGRQIRESSKGFVYKNDGTKSDGTDRRAAEKLLKERLRTAGTVRFIGPAAERLDFAGIGRMYLTDSRVTRPRSPAHRGTA